MKARLGRLMSEKEHVEGSTIAAVVTDAFWQRRLGADPKAIGSTINFGSRSATVIGVLPPAVRYPAGTDVYLPSWIFPEPPSRAAHNYRVVGRLLDGISIEQARDDMMAIARRHEQQYPNTNADKLVALMPLKVVERAAILSPGPMLELDGTLLASASGTNVPASPMKSSVAGGADKLEDIERAHIFAVLRRTDGVVGGPRGAATILGLRPNTLRNRMKRLGIGS